MSEKRTAAVDFVKRTITNIKKSIERCHTAPCGVGSEAFQARIADQVARETQTLETWETIAVMLDEAESYRRQLMEDFERRHLGEE